mgnify:FL=1
MQRAFTLIEIVIVIGLFAIMVLGIAQLYIVFGRVITIQRSSISVTLGGSAIVDTVRVAGLQAAHVVQSHTFSGVSYNSGTTTAIFELPAIDASGAIIVGTFDYVGIYVSSTTVYRTVDAAVGSSRTSGTKVLTDSLGALTFTYDTASFPSVTSVIVDATTSAVVKGQTTQMHLRSHTYLRNL